MAMIARPSLETRESRLAVDRECHEFGALGHPGRQVGDEPGDADAGDDGATRRMVVGAAVADGEGVIGEQRDQGIEVAHLCGGQERHGDLPGIVIGGRERRGRPSRTRNRAREAICRHASGDLSTTFAMSSKGVANTSANKNTTALRRAQTLEDGEEANGHGLRQLGLSAGPGSVTATSGSQGPT